MNLDNLQKDTGKFLKWDGYTEDEPMVVRFTGDPEQGEFRGNVRYEFACLTPDNGRDTKVLSCSQSALNALVTAAHEFGVSDKIDAVTWECWRTGIEYDTKYHWQVVDGKTDDIPF